MKNDTSLFSRSLYRLSVISAALIYFASFGYAQNFNEPVNFINNLGQQIIVGTVGPTGSNLLKGVSFSGGCTFDANNNLVNARA